MGLREPRRCTGRARSGLSATPWQARRSPHPLFPRQTRVRNCCAANGGIVHIGHVPRHSFYPARRFPTWFRWRKSGRRAESESGGDGLLANPRIVARRRFQPFGRRHRNRSGGFCCFSPSKSREKRKSFLMYFWGQKYQKPPHVVFRGIARAAALHGARKIKPMRHPAADAPQPAPSFSASNESAD